MQACLADFEEIQQFAADKVADLELSGPSGSLPYYQSFLDAAQEQVASCKQDMAQHAEAAAEPALAALLAEEEREAAEKLELEQKEEQRNHQ